MIMRHKNSKYRRWWMSFVSYDISSVTIPIQLTFNKFWHTLVVGIRTGWARF